MRIPGLACLFFFLSLLKVAAQQSSIPVFEIKTDPIALQQLSGEQLQVLEDNTGKLDFDQVSQPGIENGFHLNNSSKLNFSVRVTWFRFRLKNALSHEVTVAMGTDAGFSDYYITHPDDSVHHLRTGWAIPWSQKDGFRSADMISIPIKAGEELLIYEKDRRFQYLFTRTAVISLSPAETVAQTPYPYTDESSYVLNTVRSLLAGILILASFFNLFFYSTTRDKTYLYFALFTFLYSLIPYCSDLLRFFFREIPGAHYNIERVCWVLSTFCLGNFIRYYFEANRYHRVLNRVLTVMLAFYALGLVPYLLLTDSVPNLWWLILGDVQSFTLQTISAVLFIISVAYLRRKDADRSKIIPALPVLFFWGVIWPALYYSELIALYSGQSRPSFSKWIRHWNPILELICLCWLVVFFSWSLFRRYQQLQKQMVQQTLEKERERNQLIAQQKAELEIRVAERTAELKQSLEELKSTQTQLIHSEKMASLGELTAGIAHEIQNPLNFVNNFSEINNELIEEVKTRWLSAQKENSDTQLPAGQGNRDRKEELDELLNNIFRNNEKINHHGKRADSIVKGMLQHSRSSSGQKEPTDINALCDEYLRLAYHGLRAKDKTFNAKLETDFDNSIGKINVVPQDIGRVVLNLITNAFYAASPPSREGNLESDANKTPTVWLSTKREAGKILIIVKDNGAGIPANILSKIFQPFFTTKPTGQGTGLGLSLSYDIVTKGHGGEIKLDTRQGEGSSFTVVLPINN